MATPPKAAAEPSLPPTTQGALEHRHRLSPAELASLQETYRDVVLADDDDAKALTRRIVARLRRASHEELHPGCERVVIDVPVLPTGHFVMLNEKPYVGRMEVWACEAQTVLGLAHRAVVVENNRMRDDGKTVDLDRAALVERARLIQSA